MDDDDIFRTVDKTFHENLNQFKESGKFSDFKIYIDDSVYNVHKIILAASSDYFRAMLSHNSKESKENKVYLNDISVPVLDHILNFCYNHKLDLDIDNVQEILIAASILQISAVQNLCINFINYKIDSSNCLGIATIADRCNLPTLLQTALNYCLEHFPWVVKEREFLEVEETILLKIISHDNLNIDNELQVFQAITEWIEADIKNRSDKLDKLVEHVRFALMEPVGLVALTSNELVKNSTKCRSMIECAKDYLLLKNYPQMPNMINNSLPIAKPRKDFGRRQRLYAVGGWTDEFKSIASAEMYDPNLKRWIELEPMAQKRCGVGLTTLGNSIYAVGGHDGTNYLNTIERYDIEQASWFKDVAPMSHVRTSGCVISLNDKIYAIGGQVSTGAIDQVEMYDPGTNTWVLCTPMKERRLGAGIAVLNGFIYVVGGSESHNIYNSVEKYDPLKNLWVSVTPMIEPRKHLGCATYDGNIYAIGGRNNSGELDSAECYDPKTDTWTLITPMHMKRCGIGVVELGGLIYVVGGQNEDTRLNVVEAYNPHTKQWDWKKPMNHGRLGGGMTVHPQRQ